MFHGEGTYTYKNGMKYEGNYVNGKKCGQGRFEWTDGSSYDGDWENGK